MHIAHEIHKHLYYSALLGLVVGLVLGILILGLARIGGGGQPARTVTVTLPVPTTVTKTVTETMQVHGATATVTHTVTRTVTASSSALTPPGQMRLTYESGGSLIDIVYSSRANRTIRVHVGVRILIEGIGALYNATLAIDEKEINVTITLSLPQIPLVSIPTLYNVTIYLLHHGTIIGVAHGKMRLITTGETEKTVLPIEWYIGRPDLKAITNVEIKLKPIR